MNNYLIVIVGPTAIGKTDLAIRVAKEFNTVILSADSRQFYHEMSIGTAKPNSRELGETKHYFIDSHSIKDEFSVGNYENEAIELLEKLYQEKQVVVLTGGSGLYINAITKGFDDLPKGDPAVRKQLNKLFVENGIQPLQDQLKKVDPEYYHQVDLNNPQRIIRALEVSLTAGAPFSSFRLNTEKERPFKTIKIGLNTDRKKLYERINERVDKMIQQGLVDEVKLLQSFKNYNALQTVGYSEIFDFLEGKILLSEAIEKIKQNTRRFAKRQLTWFRKDQEIKWFEPENYQEIFSYLKQQIN